MWVGGILVVLYLCLLSSTETAGIAPTPTPVVIRRDYDPPAPKDLSLPIAAPELHDKPHYRVTYNQPEEDVSRAPGPDAVQKEQQDCHYYHTDRFIKLGSVDG